MLGKTSTPELGLGCGQWPSVGRSDELIQLKLIRDHGEQELTAVRSPSCTRLWQ